MGKPMTMEDMLHVIMVSGVTLTIRPVDVTNPRFGYTAKVEGFGGEAMREAGTPHGALALLLASPDEIARVRG